MPLTGVPFAGETIEVTIRVALTTGAVVREGAALTEFWAPGRTPPDSPDHTVPASWDAAARGFTCFADTTGWAPGTWTYRGRVQAATPRGPATGYSEYTALTLR